MVKSNIKDLLHTVAVVVEPAAAVLVTNPTLPQIETGFWALLAKLVAPGIMTQSKPIVFLPSVPYPQQDD